MKLLAVETATEACSVALLIDGIVAEELEIVSRQHSHLVLPMIDKLLNKEGLDLIDLNGLVFGQGPGSFTGLRIATGVVQGLALGANLPVIGISTLAALAQGYFNSEVHQRVYVAMDARMGEIYWAEYVKNNSGLAELVAEEQVIRPDEVKATGLSGAAIGSGWKNYQEELVASINAEIYSINDQCLPHASCIVQLASMKFKKNPGVSAEQVSPVYLRNKVAKKEIER